MADYFVEDPKYNDDIFRHRFLMSKRLFLKIVSEVEANNPWFEEGVDARMKKSFTQLQKVTSAIKQLAIGNPPDENDEYLHMAERTSRECLEYFCETVCKIYAPELLRRPTSHDMALLYQAHEEKHHLPDEKKFKKQHEAARKDVERTFGVLESKWGIMNWPMRARSVKKIDDGNAIAPVHIRDPPIESTLNDSVLNELMDEDTHWRLKHDLVEHLGRLDLPHLLVESDKE
ncbi:uncharacterized protein LOC110888513 [Helianthus annuus]|uniref:uncharacterized protein LOC110888513 n=1 Tax=Helianthus annuus TaxID=4232 RepID=UPI000B90A31B|nr:uncharacterized protein LOC110888513 [Helianthus annuus]